MTQSSSLFDSNSLLSNNESRRRSQSLDARSSSNAKNSAAAYSPFGDPSESSSHSMPYSGFSPPNTDFLFPNSGKSVDFAQSMSPSKQPNFLASYTDSNYTRGRSNTVDVLPSYSQLSQLSSGANQTSGPKSSTFDPQMEELIFAMEDTDIYDTKTSSALSPSQQQHDRSRNRSSSSSYMPTSQSIPSSFGSDKALYGSSVEGDHSFRMDQPSTTAATSHPYSSPFSSPRQGSSLPSSLSGSSFSAHSTFGGGGGLGSPPSSQQHSYGSNGPAASTPQSSGGPPPHIQNRSGNSGGLSARSNGGHHPPPSIQTQPNPSTSWADVSNPSHIAQSLYAATPKSSSPSGNVREHPAGEYPSRTLFVRNISSGVDDEELKHLFSQYGEIRNMYTNCKQRGFVMISYFDIRHAKTAMKHLQHHTVKRRQIDIHYSIPKDNPSEKDVNQGTLVIFNLDSKVSNEELLSVFGKYGEIKEIRETPHKKHHKFIEFYDVRDAEKAMQALNKSEMHGKKIKIEPSRPGGRPKHTPHSNSNVGTPSGHKHGSMPGTPIGEGGHYPAWPDPNAFVPDYSQYQTGRMYGNGNSVPQSPLTPHHQLGRLGSPSMYGANSHYPYASVVGSPHQMESHATPTFSVPSSVNSFHTTPSTPGPSGFGSPTTPHSASFSPMPPGQQQFTHHPQHHSNGASHAPNGFTSPGTPHSGGSSGSNGAHHSRSNRSHHSDSGSSSSRSGKSSEKFRINMDKVRRGEDKRTTLMIKNIPNKYNQKMLLAEIDKKFKDKYDFFYLPIDFKNKCNVGYAFINLVNPSVIISFSREFNKKKWGKFNSEKVCQLNYGRIQGKKNLVSHFENSSLMGELVDCRPVFFDLERKIYEKDYSHC